MAVWLGDLPSLLMAIFQNNIEPKLSPEHVQELHFNIQYAAMHFQIQNS